MMTTKLSWNPKTTAEPLRAALNVLGHEYPIVESAQAEPTVFFQHDPTMQGVTIARSARQATVTYGRTCDALRAVGTLLAEGVESGEDGGHASDFTCLGIMLDCSRNAVMNVDHFKRWLRRLALMGFNMAMLYTEDTYALPGEDYFGYMRGRYSADELRDIDDYAHALGIEMIACMQTLGHLEQILKWSAYADVKDTTSVVLAAESKTYELIDKMIAHWADVFRSRRIHVGMDETHDLGRGRYMDLHGHERGYDIFNQHLKRVLAICDRHGLKPMIWSDMYFRMGSKTGDYYDSACVIPPDVKSAIPQGTELVYWDYYHEDEAFYLDWIARHRALGFEPIMGSGVWTWGIPWYGRQITESTAGSCVRACRKAGLKELFFTLWGDNGGYCDFDSALAGLSYAAELAYTGRTDDNVLAKRFRAICSADYRAQALAGDLGVPGQVSAVLWDDPLLAIHYRNAKLNDAKHWDRQAKAYEQLAGTLRPHENDRAAGDIGHAILVARCLASKMKVISAVHDAYARKDKKALKTVIISITTVIEMITQLDESYRSLWLARNKPFGLEVIQIRFAGQVRRFWELADRLEEFLSGHIDAIGEFDEPVPAQPVALPSTYAATATGSCIL